MIGRILPLLILLAGVGLFFGYVQPTYTGDIAIARAKIDGYDKALAAAELFREKQEALMAEQNAIPSEARARIEAFLPDGVDNVQLIVDLNALASRSGISLSNFDVQEGRDDEELDSGRLAVEGAGVTDYLDITMSGVGTYAAFRTFLDGVEHSLRIMDLVSLSIADSETGIYSYDMTFRIYWLR